MGSATVSVALVGVSPTSQQYKTTHGLGSVPRMPEAIGGTPMAAAETAALLFFN